MCLPHKPSYPLLMVPLDVFLLLVFLLFLDFLLRRPQTTATSSSSTPLLLLLLLSRPPIPPLPSRPSPSLRYTATLSLPSPAFPAAAASKHLPLSSFLCTYGPLLVPPHRADRTNLHLVGMIVSSVSSQRVNQSLFCPFPLWSPPITRSILTHGPAPMALVGMCSLPHSLVPNQASYSAQASSTPVWRSQVTWPTSPLTWPT